MFLATSEGWTIAFFFSFSSISTLQDFSSASVYVWWWRWSDLFRVLWIALCWPVAITHIKTSTVLPLGSFSQRLPHVFTTWVIIELRKCTLFYKGHCFIGSALPSRVAGKNNHFHSSRKIFLSEVFIKGCNKLAESADDTLLDLFERALCI